MVSHPGGLSPAHTPSIPPSHASLVTQTSGPPTIAPQPGSPFSYVELGRCRVQGTGVDDVLSPPPYGRLDRLDALSPEPQAQAHRVRRRHIRSGAHQSEEWRLH